MTNLPLCWHLRVEADKLGWLVEKEKSTRAVPLAVGNNKGKVTWRPKWHLGDRQEIKPLMLEWNAAWKRTGGATSASKRWCKGVKGKLPTKYWNMKPAGMCQRANIAAPGEMCVHTMVEEKKTRVSQGWPSVLRLRGSRNSWNFICVTLAPKKRARGFCRLGHLWHR